MSTFGSSFEIEIYAPGKKNQLKSRNPKTFSAAARAGTLIVETKFNSACIPLARCVAVWEGERADQQQQQ